MSKFHIISAATTAFATVVVAGIITTSRSATLPPPIDVPARYMPGSPLPDDGDCEWHMYEDQMRFCRGHADGWLFFTYDMRARVIDHVTTENPGELTIGDLMLMWGIPSGIDQNRWGVYVYWGSRSAFVNGPRFGPQSRVAFITYRLQAYPQSTWRGFAHHP